MININGVSSGYGKSTVVKDIVYDIPKGALTSIIGPNGCGKSTFLKTIVGILPTFSGNITIDGESAADLKSADIARRIAYLAQERKAPDMTVEELVLHGRYPHLSFPMRYSQTDRCIAAAAMAKVGIQELSATSVSMLSGGMRQKAYIAMSLAQDTDYILLDEPTTFLDTAHRLEVMRTLRTLSSEGRGIACVMHDLPLAFAYSDRIAVMKAGEIILTGTPDEICASHVIEELFGIKVSSQNGEYFYKIRRD